MANISPFRPSRCNLRHNGRGPVWVPGGPNTTGRRSVLLNEFLLQDVLDDCNNTGQTECATGRARQFLLIRELIV